MSKNLVFEKSEIIWKDRRRYFGLPLSFSRYEVTKDRLTTHEGFFRTVTNELMIFRIMDIKLVRTLGQKIFGVGTVIVMSSDKSCPELHLKSIKRSNEVRLFLSRLTEEERAAKGVSKSEFLGGVPFGGE